MDDSSNPKMAATQVEPRAGELSSPPLLQVICFSMDRVFQLSEYLRTLHNHVRFRGANLRDAEHPVARIAVICRCSTPEIRDYYGKIERRFAPHVTFLYESEQQSFAECLLLSIENGGASRDNGGVEDADKRAATCKYVMFNVDDAFYFDDVELADAFAFLDGGESDAQRMHESGVWPFAFHVKLAPSIWRSHLTNKPMLPLPPMQTVVTSSTDTACGSVPFDAAYHVFDPARGCLDWKYPWELSGSVYLRSTVQRVVADIQANFGTKGISHPNHLELRGHQVVQQWTSGGTSSTASDAQRRQLECACSLWPKMHVFAINQVQDVFNNRLYEDVGGDLQGAPQGGDLTNLLRLYQAGETLDEAFYRRNRLSSVHIGTLVLKAKDLPPSKRQQDLVSVVMPVFNVAQYVEQALLSITRQTYTHLEILVIDDASADTTSEVLARLLAQDQRIRYIRNETNVGVAASLNKGFALAKGKYIVRMDGDDIALPQRIERQLNYLHENPEVSIVGTSVIILRAHEGSRSPTARVQLETAVYPTSPLVTKWRMLFGCFAAHPTVMLRRHVLETLASKGEECYSTSQTSSEDYELWLRCLYKYSFSIQSMGDALLVHRKHTGNVSTVRRARQIDETQAIASSVIQFIVASDDGAGGVPSAHVLPLFDVNACGSVDPLKHSIAVLQKLQSDVCSSAAASVKAKHDELECEREYIRQDAAAREGELALKAMLIDPIRGTQLWSAFAAQHPQVSRNAFQKLFTK